MIDGFVFGKCATCNGYFLGDYVDQQNGEKNIMPLLHFTTPDDIRFFIEWLSEIHFGIVCGEFDKLEIPQVFKEAFDGE